MKKITKASLLLLLFSSYIGYAQNTSIPDANFESFLEANGMGDGINNNGQVLTANINAVTVLDVGNQGISDLTGIEGFVALTTLVCYVNQLTSLDVSSNTALNILYCNNNQLTSLILNTSLVQVYCHENQLTSLDLSSSTSLSVLDCHDNLLTSLTSTSLIVLNCYNNLLTSLDIASSTGLTYLSCFNNQLTSLDISTNTALAQLLCGQNQLTSLDVTTNTELNVLYCEINQLTSLDVSTNTSLIDLSFVENQITSLDVSTNTALNFLYCRNNQITSLDTSTNTALIALNCSNNQLANLNVANGNNTSIAFFSAVNNPNLNCIQVDDVAYSTENWLDIDATASYSTDCELLSTDDFSLNTIFSVYPNPATDYTIVKSEIDSPYLLVDYLGRTVLKGNISIGENTIPLANITMGVYFIKVASETQRIIKN